MNDIGGKHLRRIFIPFVCQTMAKGRKLKSRPCRRLREEEEKPKEETMKKVEDRSSTRNIMYFKSEEMQEICSILNVDELVDDHQCFLGAVVIGKFEVVKKLLKDGHSIDFLDENHETALMYAVKHFRQEMIYFLLARGANVSMVDGEHNNALLLAAQSDLWDQDSFSGLWTTVRGHPYLAPHHTNKMGYSLLHYVTKRQWGGVLGSLLAVPVPLDCCTNKGVTPLIMAASRGDAAFTQALLEGGANIALEDQQSCTALCYAIAFSLLKNMKESNRALELLLAAMHDDNSKLTLELYLQRRLGVLVNPPKNKFEFSKTVNGVMVHVFTFFSRYIYSGMELLLELSAFHKLREALERHLEEPQYTQALLAVVLELVRHCHCCCQALSQTELADLFFTAQLTKPLLLILQRYGMGKSTMIKAVFMPLLYVCTSDSYRARTWLEANHMHLHTYYNRYMRAFPALFIETNGDPHLKIEKSCSQSFQTIMRTLKTKGKIVTKEEHAKAQKDITQQMVLMNSVNTVMKPNCSDSLQNTLKCMPEKSFSRKKLSTTSVIYSSIVQHNFGKLDLLQMVKDSSNKEEGVSSTMATNITGELETPFKKLRKVKKCRIAIKEIQTEVEDEMDDINDRLDNCPQQKSCKEIENESLSLSPLGQKVFNENSNIKTYPKHKTMKRFSEGYQLFKMDDEMLSDVVSVEEHKITKERCDLLDFCGLVGGHKAVPEIEVNSTIIYLESIFHRIIKRFDSTWKKQFEKGYLEAEGDSEDLLKLMKVLPALENYHMEKLMNKWSNFYSQVKDHARKNHVVYAAMVSEMQLFLLELEAKLDESNVKVDSDNENSSEDSYIDTSFVLNGHSDGINTLSNGKPVENLINKHAKIKKKFLVTMDNRQTNNEKKYLERSEIADNEILTDSTDNIYYSDSGDDNSDVIKSVWDLNIDNFKLKSSLDVDDLSITNKTQECTEDVVIMEESSLGQTNSVDKVETMNEAKCSPVAKSNAVKVEAKEKLEGISVVEESGKDSQLCDNVLKKPPPGFEHVNKLNESADNPNSVESYCGNKYEFQSKAMMSLPECKTETVCGGLRIVSLELQTEFKLFNGLNFGNIELGLSSAGMPLATRQFQKHDTLCNQFISSSLPRLLHSMLALRHDNLLPYVAVCDQPQCVVFATPLCSHDLGQFVRHQRQVFAENLDARAKFAPTLITMAKQLISGLHYLHTLDQPIVHGNLKPSNIMVDLNGTLRLAEFGLHQILFQQQSPPQSAMIWWARECYVHYLNTWKYECTLQSDIQSAGMVMYFILTMGEHPFGEYLSDILQNILSGTLSLRSLDFNATDLLYWMLARTPGNRPNTFDVLRHQMFWSNNKKWDLLSTCCGLGVAHILSPLPLDKFYADLDALARQEKMHTAWIAILKKNCECEIGSDMFDDTPGSLLRFLAQNLKKWGDVKDIFLELFPALPLNLFRMVERTVWIEHPEFEPFTRIAPLS